MGKVHQLSAENYIRTKARTLPIFKCLVTPGWEDMGMANVIVMRKHVNGNCTVGLYLVDLMCLGIKDTYYLFNEREDEVNERFNIGPEFFMETDYVTAHNIVYAGLDFAAEFDIEPHKDFGITKYILEDDDEKIPVIDVEVGDDDGKPHLMVDRSYNYGPRALEKLKKNAGEGNYYFTIGDDDFFDGEDDTDDEDDFDGDFDEGFNEDEEEDDFDDNEQLTDFNTLKDRDTDELMEQLEDGMLLMTTETLYRSELLWRRLKEQKPLSVLTDEKLDQTPEINVFRQNRQAWEMENEASQNMQEEVFQAIQDISYKDWTEDKKTDGLLKLMKKYRYSSNACVMMVNSSPVTIISEFPEIVNALKDFPPAVQLFLAAWDALRQDKDPELSRIRQAATLQEAFPGNTSLHAWHIKSFWLLKALEALTAKDVKNIIYYHSLVRTSGVGGQLKYFYAALLNYWLCEFLNIDEADILFQPNE